MSFTPHSCGSYKEEACHANSKQMVARGAGHLRKGPVEEKG